VIRYWTKFLARFPSVKSLADAELKDVLGLWTGLGYYSRARNLHLAARELVARFDGALPDSVDALLSLPGFGRYTAGAVASIAFELEAPLVDGNVARVLSRLLELDGTPGEKSREAALWAAAEELVTGPRPGDWNQALMELGATVCLPRKPACPACPVRKHCRALELGIADELPESRARRAPVDVTVAAALVEREGRVLLVRRPEGRLLGRMWEVPQTSLESKGLPDLAREVLERHGLRVTPGPLAVRARHAITFRRITLEGYRARLAGAAPGDPERFRWATPEEVATLPVSSATKKLLAGLRTPQMPLAF
jgi:A/G-specific adenine glycosylase